MSKSKMMLEAGDTKREGKDALTVTPAMIEAGEAVLISLIGPLGPNEADLAIVARKCFEAMIRAAVLTAPDPTPRV